MNVNKIDPCCLYENILTEINKNDPTLKLYASIPYCRRKPLLEESWTTNMISMINKTTKKSEFKQAWQNNPEYKLDMKGSFKLDGDTGLHKAVCSNNLEMTKFFIKHLGVEHIDSVNTFNSTPLIAAVKWRKIMRHSIDLEVIRQLLVAGADVNLAFGDVRYNGFESSPLLLAIKARDIELAKLLLQFGARKLVRFTPDKKALLKQKFSDEQNKIYKEAKKGIITPKDTRNLFILGNQDANSTLSCFPKEIIARILMSDGIQSSNQHRIAAAKRMIEENEKQALMDENVNCENTLMIAYC